jgi:hypothetical protein
LFGYYWNVAPELTDDQKREAIAVATAKQRKAATRRRVFLYFEQGSGLALVSLGIACFSAISPVILWFVKEGHVGGYRLAAGLAVLGVGLIVTGATFWSYGKVAEDEMKGVK